MAFLISPAINWSPGESSETTDLSFLGRPLFFGSVDASLSVSETATLFLGRPFFISLISNSFDEIVSPHVFAFASAISLVISNFSITFAYRTASFPFESLQLSPCSYRSKIFP